MNDNDDFADVLRAIPLYRPAEESRRGRISSTTVHPGEVLPAKVVVDFGSTPEGPDQGPDLEIATRSWEHLREPGEREIRGFCGERDLMERRMRDPLSAHSFALPEDARWSTQTIDIDGAPHTFTVLATSRSWVAAALLPGPFLVRIYTPAPGPAPGALRRITSVGELEPVRGRG
ncbi:hypothetical protein [Allosalinactinospora lopnorensis]|uniref:hypothetical protein n=1 Tax=Allosalinactinospora lopnorensis TaxID=1352348 RepID=UPI000623E6EA|nr:hypothetical protein [Allosalinactinospora lopnorensis]